MSRPDYILHIGAPKAGSSALQTALCHAPQADLAGGGRLRVIGSSAASLFRPLTGAALTAAAERSRLGYLAFHCPGEENADCLEAAARIVLSARAEGDIAILSSEGWLDRPAPIQPLIARLHAEGLRGRAVVFLRPGFEALNAAFWQWHVWKGENFARWARRAAPHRVVMPALRHWQAIAGLELQLESAVGDVVARFNAAFGTTLPGLRRNGTVTPALLSFLLRNGAFRADMHDPDTEFVVGRWCRFETSERLWGFTRPLLEELHPVLLADARAVLGEIGPSAAEVWRAEAPGWVSRYAYTERPQVLGSDSPESLADLLKGLRAGVDLASERPRRPPPTQLPATLPEWDSSISAELRALLAADARARRRLSGTVGSMLRGVLGRE